MTPPQKALWSALKRLQGRFAEIAMASRLERLLKLGRKPKLIRAKDRVSLRIYREQNHRLPHFHIEFKRQFAASYMIGTGERLAGSLPAKYEKEMLAWARDNSALLLREWNALNTAATLQLTLEGGQN
jgi:hypothetical protein